MKQNFKHDLFSLCGFLNGILKWIVLMGIWVAVDLMWALKCNVNPGANEGKWLPLIKNSILIHHWNIKLEVRSSLCTGSTSNKHEKKLNSSRKRKKLKNDLSSSEAFPILALRVYQSRQSHLGYRESIMPTNR